MEQIKNLWEEFRILPYPEDAHIDGLDLALLDVTIAGCIISFISNRGNLDAEKIHILKKSMMELDSHLKSLPESAKGYFIKLKIIGELVFIELKI